MPNTGQQPGKGTYKCTKCGKEVELKDDKERLPGCPACGFPEFNEVE
ncbi:zinc ribbon-containing protein [Selenihalanaerobacter shriftii]|uniref:Zinc-ribbon containing domain-containing protein n=1 Tax=Selenihalanaerobacter shriftii TaxID=142842 RepID=A0A1T4Q7Z2_9FIRM|nr:rubredoxin-like protein [Selenihalanaerobacter shriftii]SJZ99882.1 Zinc-ribbon containing domain-containing protein [Selenihalanaerobacter shriftii]